MQSDDQQSTQDPTFETLLMGVQLLAITVGGFIIIFRMGFILAVFIGGLSDTDTIWDCAITALISLGWLLAFIDRRKPGLIFLIGGFLVLIGITISISIAGTFAVDESKAMMLLGLAISLSVFMSTIRHCKTPSRG